MRDFRRYYNLVFFTTLSLCIFSCQGEGPQEQTFSGDALGTNYQIKFFHHEKVNINPGIDSIFGVINSSMSTYQADSDISRINAGDSTVTVDQHFKEVFITSKKIYEESRGMFDPTVGKLVNAYGFGPQGPQRDLLESELDSIRQFVGFDKVELTGDGRLNKIYPGIFIDFNAIAKGYAVDVIAGYLDGKNIDNYLVEVGGELVAKGKNLGRNQVWAVGIDDPSQKEGERRLQTAVKLNDRAMATSGNYRKFRTDPETGRYYVHTVNPVTGLAEKSDLLSVSVLAENCTLADGYATAFMALGYQGAQDMLTRLNNVDVYFIYVAENSEEKIFTTPGFAEALLED